MTDSTLLLWGFGLLALSLLLLVLELFIPSAGVIGAVAALATIAGVVCFWRVSSAWGASATLVVLVLGPMAVALMLKVYPNTPVGRRLILGSSEDPEEAAARAVREREAARAAEAALIGQEGEALTDMRPVGEVRIGGRRMEALAESGQISARQRVRVVDIVDNQVKVRKV